MDKIIDTKNNNDRYIGALDGIRALAICIVVWYHLWQQNWLSPYIRLDWKVLKYIGFKTDFLAVLVRYGFLWVDLLVLLSAFCNFYPYARAIILGEEWPDTKTFFIKRFARIYPSYLLAMLVSFIISIIGGAYDGQLGYAVKDLLTHITCTSVLFPSTIIGTKINFVLWTVEMEVLFYVLIPFLAKLYRKSLMISYLVMLAVGEISINYVLYSKNDSLRMFVNYPLTFFAVYANGFIACIIYVLINKYKEDNKYCDAVSTIMSLLSLICLFRIVRGFGDPEKLSEYQLSIRIVLSCVFAVFLCSTSLVVNKYRLLYDNALARKVCLISYNLYLWHQYIFAQMVMRHIPGYAGTDNPAWSGNTKWQYTYTILAIINALVVAILATLYIEKPCAKYILKRTGVIKRRRR